jgi:hypothetical protein
VIACPNRKYRRAPDALTLAALVVKSLDELTLDAIESAARRAQKKRLGPTAPRSASPDAAMTVLDAADGLSTGKDSGSYVCFWHKADIGRD